MANSPHDALFRYTFGQPEHAVALLRALLPARLVSKLDWATLTPLPGTRLDRRLRRHQTDQLYAIRALDGPTHLVHLLIEHSSTVDRWMALRLLDYSVAIWRQLVRQDPAQDVLPPIHALVLHHGTERWSAPLEFTALLSAGRTGLSSGPRYRYAVKSLATARPEQIDGLALTLLGKLTLAFLQFVPRASLVELQRAFRRWGGLVREVLRAPSGEEAMAALSEYVLTTTSLEQHVVLEVVAMEVGRRGSEIMETTAERLIRKGREEGREAGRAEGRVAERLELLTAMLERRFGPLPPHARDHLAAATAADLKRFSERLFDTATLDDVLREP